MLKNLTEQTLKLVEAIRGQQSVEKAYTTATGLNWYDLEPVAKLLYPVITPLRNEIPRVAADGGNATNWKALTGINVNNTDAGVSEGNRGATIDVTEVDYTAPYRGIGLEDYETFEAEYGSKNFDDLRALMTEGLLNSLMIKEEAYIIGGNGSTGIALGVPATPTAVDAGVVAGATTSGAALSIIVVALTLDGYQRSTVAGGVKTTYNKTNADGSVDANVNAGSSNKSAAKAFTPTAGHGFTVGTTAIKGAVAYAWYWGAGAGNEVLGAITTANKFVITTDAGAGAQNATAITADCSKSALVFSGIITQALQGSGYFQSLDGAVLTSDGAGGIVEIDAAFKSFWDNYRVSPDRMIVNAQELININKKIIANGGAPLIRLNGDFGANGAAGLTISAGTVVGSYLNKFTMAGGQVVPFMLHPNVPPGTIIFYSSKPPYATSKVRNVLQMKVRREYYQIDWALKSRKYETGVYADELLQMYSTFSFGVLANIGNG